MRDSSSIGNYLGDLWQHAPRRVALTHTLLAIFVCLTPLLFGRFRLLPWLAPAEQQELLGRLLRARNYFLRMIAFALRGHALMAALRDAELRVQLLPQKNDDKWHAAHDREETRDISSTPRGRRPGAIPDFVVIGSGAGGAIVAAELARAGATTHIIEEGGWHRRATFAPDLYSAVSTLFRDFGAQVTKGRGVFPVLQGCCVGGSTVISGAIVHRLTREVHASWCATDPALATAPSFSELEAAATAIESDLEVRANLAERLPSLPAAHALDGLGWAYQAMHRIAPGCQGTGYCLQGCPSGGKWSMERSYVPQALAAGAEIHSRSRVLQVLHQGSRAIGVLIETEKGMREVRARRGVVVAAGVVESPLLLRRSGVHNAHLGRHLQCHLGVGCVGLLDRPVRDVEGPPQGIEVMEFTADRLKLATQLLPPELLLARATLDGNELLDLLTRVDHLASWTASVQSEAEGEITTSPLTGQPVIHFDPAPADLQRLRTGLWRLAQLLFALGAKRVWPAAHGFDATLTDPRRADDLLQAPLDARNYFVGVGHLFGTCRMGGAGAAWLGPISASMASTICSWPTAASSPATPASIPCCPSCRWHAAACSESCNRPDSRCPILAQAGLIPFPQFD